MSLEQAFIDFYMQMSDLFKHEFYTNRDLAHAASYFWERVNSLFKLKWKSAAKQLNHIENHTGKRKLHGFWHFAKSLEEHMLHSRACIFFDIFGNLLSEYQILWNFPSEGLIDDELNKAVLMPNYYEMMDY